MKWTTPDWEYSIIQTLPSNEILHGISPAFMHHATVHTFLYSKAPVLLKYYDTSRQKATGLISNEITSFFNLPNPSSCTMDLALTQRLNEMSTSIYGDVSNLMGLHSWLQG
jgi:hypothetical protein